MKDTFNLVHNISFFECIEVSFYTIFRMGFFRKLFVGLFVIGFVGVILNYNYISNNKWYLIIPLTLFLPLFILTLFSVFFSIFNTIFMIVKPNYFKNIKIKFTHWGIEKTFDCKEFLNPWSNFLKYKESKKYLFLFYTKEIADAIPKKLFNTEDELNDFKKLISEKLKQA